MKNPKWNRCVCENNESPVFTCKSDSYDNCTNGRLNTFTDKSCIFQTAKDGIDICNSSCAMVEAFDAVVSRLIAEVQVERRR
jgi:hypothetical protein